MSATAVRIVGRGPWPGGKVVTAHVERTLPAALRQPGLADLEAVAARPPMQPEFLAALRAGTPAETAALLGPFADPKALVVVTGQQPGCAGGPLLVLAKAATAVALARIASDRLRRPVVPVFWNAADDVDFDEIARVSWPDGRGEPLFLELSRDARRSQAWVGELPASADAAVTQAVLELLEPAARQRLEPLLPAAAADHGDWVGQFLGRVFPELLVVDPRLPVLRRFAAPLFATYLDTLEHATARLTAIRDELAASGFPLALAPESVAQGVFLVVQGQRHKTREIAILRRTLREEPESIGAGVILRPLIQDTLFPVVASVVGPAELAYLHELSGLRGHLGAPPVALVPRLGATFLEAGELESATRLGLEPAALLQGAETFRALARRRGAPRLREAGEAFAQLERRLQTLGDDIQARGSVERVLRQLGKLRGELEAGLEGAALRGLWQAEPGLEGLPARLQPQGKPQERSVASLWLLAKWGSSSAERLVELATTHLESLERGRLEHLLVVA